MPPSTIAAAPPRNVPERFAPSAMARFFLGNTSASREFEQGLATASPTPTPMRAKASVVKLPAAPPSAVITDHRPTPKAISFLRVMKSEIRPMAMPTTE
jgi:hypothetical protein